MNLQNYFVGYFCHVQYSNKNKLTTNKSSKTGHKQSVSDGADINTGETRWMPLSLAWHIF